MRTSSAVGIAATLVASVGLGADSPASLLSVGKHDSGSRLDSLSYTVVDDSGNAVLEVIDYEMDGQPDLRMHFGSDRYIEIWHVDRWIRIQRIEGVSGVQIAGQ